MPEADPSSPGHVGHTPQHVGEMIVRARAAGLTSSVVFTHYSPAAYAMQVFLRAPQRFAGLSQLASLLRIEDYKRRSKLSRETDEPLERDASVAFAYQAARQLSQEGRDAQDA